MAPVSLRVRRRPVVLSDVLGLSSSTRIVKCIEPVLGIARAASRERADLLHRTVGECMQSNGDLLGSLSDLCYHWHCFCVLF